MKLATIALALAFAVSSTFALAGGSQHKHNKYKSGAKTYQGTVGMGSGRANTGLGRYGGSSNDRGGLVGGADRGTYKP